MLPWKLLRTSRRRARAHALSPRVERVEHRLLLSVFGVDTRKPVQDTTVPPYSAVVYIGATFADPKLGSVSGTGALIDPLHVLTAAHVVYDASNASLAPFITVEPGRNRSFLPYGAFDVVSVNVDPGYTSPLNTEGSDLAVLTLDHPVPRAGSFGLRSEPDSFFSQAVLATAGYPGDLGKKTGTRMFSSIGTTVGADAGLIGHKIDTFHGQSGSPLWEVVDGRTYIVGVHVFGKISRRAPNLAVRLTPEKVREIQGWLGRDAQPDAGLAARGVASGASSPVLPRTPHANAAHLFAARGHRRHWARTA